jgi:putative endonuclease
MIDNRRKGMRYEVQARQYLEAQGLICQQQNYHCRFGEIDLVMCDADSLCFIEVKFRSNSRFGGAAYSIPKSKQRKLIKSALFFITEHKKFSHCALRFDAFLIQQQLASNEQFNWIKNAFYAE